MTPIQEEVYRVRMIQFKAIKIANQQSKEIKRIQAQAPKAPGIRFWSATAVYGRLA